MGDGGEGSDDGQTGAEDDGTGSGDGQTGADDDSLTLTAPPSLGVPAPPPPAGSSSPPWWVALLSALLSVALLACIVVGLVTRQRHHNVDRDARARFLSNPLHGSQDGNANMLDMGKGRASRRHHESDDPVGDVEYDFDEWHAADSQKREKMAVRAPGVLNDWWDEAADGVNPMAAGSEVGGGQLPDLEGEQGEGSASHRGSGVFKVNPLMAAEAVSAAKGSAEGDHAKVGASAWTQHVDEHGVEYFVNGTTGEVSYDLPEDLAIEQAAAHVESAKALLEALTTVTPDAFEASGMAPERFECLREAVEADLQGIGRLCGDTGAAAASADASLEELSMNELAPLLQRMTDNLAELELASKRARARWVKSGKMLGVKDAGELKSPSEALNALMAAVENVRTQLRPVEAAASLEGARLRGEELQEQQQGEQNAYVRRLRAKLRRTAKEGGRARKLTGLGGSLGGGIDGEPPLVDGETAERATVEEGNDV